MLNVLSVGWPNQDTPDVNYVVIDILQNEFQDMDLHKVLGYGSILL